MKQRQTLNRILASVLCLALCLGCIFAAGNLLEEKTSRRTYGTFKKIGKDCDVLFLGSSHVWNGVQPMKLYNDYGITAYNIGYSAYRIPMSYWAFRQCLRFSTPKLLVMDIALLSETAMSNSDASLHQLFDAFPSDLRKLHALNDIGETLEGPVDKLDLMFDLSSYHGRWSELEQGDFEKYNNIYRGASAVFEVTDISEAAALPENARIDAVTDQYNVSMAYLEKIITLAQQNDVQVLLTMFPQPCTMDAQEYYNWAEILESQYGITYINLNDHGIADYSTDFFDFTSGAERASDYAGKGQLLEDSVYDNSAHLNIVGAFKLTDWLGEYIKENYELTDHRGEKGFDSWDIDCEAWLADLQWNLEEALSEYSQLSPEAKSVLSQLKSSLIPGSSGE